VPPGYERKKPVLWNLAFGKSGGERLALRVHTLPPCTPPWCPIKHNNPEMFVGTEVWWSTFGPPRTAAYAAFRGLLLHCRLYHFLFNSLNTLFGTIERSNNEARRLVLNLSDVFRYLLRSDRTLIEIEEELKIVRAYLEIEQLRLGPKLRTEMQVDDAVLHASIPLLSIQPLVENAVKHGVASRMGTGFVRLTIARQSEWISVTVSNSGECDTRALTSTRNEGGIGLANVRRRLELCYGEAARFEARSSEGVTTIGFLLQLKLATAVP